MVSFPLNGLENNTLYFVSFKRLKTEYRTYFTDPVLVGIINANNNTIEISPNINEKNTN